MPDSNPTGPISTGEARDRFSEVLNRAAFGKERVVLTRRGKPLVAVVPIEDVEALEAWEDAQDIAAADAARAEWERDGRQSITLEELAQRHGIKLGDDAE